MSNNNKFIDYGELLNDAMYGIVRSLLKKIDKDGLVGNHHFYISFLTGYDGVQIPQWLRDQYPIEMTIVLQHQFQDLKITDDYFAVSLVFNSKNEMLQIPFQSITSFADPSSKFGLQFEHAHDLLAPSAPEHEVTPEDVEQLIEEIDKQKSGGKNKTVKKPNFAEYENVISLDKFRKPNRKPKK